MTQPQRKILEEKGYSSAFKAFVRIMDLWQVKTEARCKILGTIPQATYYKYKASPPTHYSYDMLERISLVIGIYKALQILIPSKALANRWINDNNNHTLFNNEPPLNKITQHSMSHLYEVRRYLDYLRGGWS